MSGAPPTQATRPDLCGTTKCGDGECLAPNCQMTPEQFVAIVRERTTELALDHECYNFVVVRTTGVGKSSLVNGLRLLSDQDSDGYAPVGDDTEGTHRICQYRYPGYPHIRIFDAPGGGTDEHPEHGYFFDKSCYLFDCILLVNHGSMRSLDMSVIRSSLAWNIPCAIVRTQCDNTLINLSRVHRTMSRDQLKEMLRATTEKTMARKSAELGILRELLPPVFHVSATVYQYDDCKQYEMDDSSLLAWLAITAIRSRKTNVDLMTRNPLPDISDNVCPVCLESFADVVLGPCGHTICRGCSADWTQDCVLCRGPIAQKFYVDMPNARLIRPSAPERS
ncbi:hypothetical protein BV898_14474 [Hypsibius exemplaris]|uniref:RING-type domain-containing protein n=1 Tax=Hypsibius exemplaris TaxID=2072580 RepID=A0A9X6RJL3_HYPEX|nr:hypothetical protein BV898_14474 [Hypsibius exemplaris]